MCERRQRRRDVVAVSLAACAFGCVSVVAKLAYLAGAEPRALLVTRLVVAAVALLAATSPVLLRSRRRPGSRAILMATIGGAAFAAAGFLEFESLARLPVAAAVVLIFLAPVWVAVGSGLVWGRRIGWRGATCLGLVLAGVAALAGSPGGAHLDALGAVFAVAASLLYAGMFLLMEELVDMVGPTLTIAMIGAAAAMVAVVAEPDGVPKLVGSAQTAAYGIPIGLATACSLLLLAGGLRTTPAFVASIITGAEPVVAAVLSWLVLDELLTPMQIAGGIAVVAGVVAVAGEER